MRMHRSFLLAVPVLALFLAGCPAKPKDGECKTTEDCSVQGLVGKVCVQGRCQECGEDTDCKAGFICNANRCEPRPQCDASNPCPSGEACKSGKCVTVVPVTPIPDCTTDSQCGDWKACQAGKCVESGPVACPAKGGKLLPVYFAFDKALLTPESQSILSKSADCIKAKGFTTIVIEGNCDDRGTDEYNLQLGQRRAEAAKKFLVNLGVPVRSIRTVSYGKQKPVCTEATDECWQKNRRDDVVAR